MAASFLAVFFGRAASTVRERYGDTAYIDASGEHITIADRFGPLGSGATLRDAMQAADAAIATRRSHMPTVLDNAIP